MKLKDLLNNRDKLKKYDELKEWEKRFADMVDIPTWRMLISCSCNDNIVALPLPDHIKQIIVSALEAEIAKLDGDGE